MAGPEELFQNVNQNINANQNINQNVNQNQQILGVDDWAFDENHRLLVRDEVRRRPEDDYVVVEKEARIEGREILLRKLEKYRSFWGDGTRLTRIKSATSQFESYMLKNVAQDERGLESQIAEVKQQYINMIAFCNEYIEAHTNERKGKPKARLELVRNLKDLNTKEIKNLDAVIRQHREGAAEAGQRASVTWGDIILQARTMERRPVEGAVVIDENNKKLAHKRCVQHQLAMILGENDLFVKTDIFKENGIHKYKTDDSKLNNWVRGSDLFGKITKANATSNKFRINTNVLKKFNTIKLIEDILQISISNESIYYSVEKRNEQVDGKTIERTFITDIHVCENVTGSLLNNTHTDAQKKERLIVDAKLAKALCNISAEGVGRLFTGVLSPEQISNLKANIMNVHEKLYNGGSRILYDEEWTKEGASYLQNLSNPGYDFLRKANAENKRAAQDPNYVRQYDVYKSVKKDKETAFLCLQLDNGTKQTLDLKSVRNAERNTILNQTVQLQNQTNLEAYRLSKRRGTPATGYEKALLDNADITILETAKLARIKRVIENGEKVEMPKFILQDNSDKELFPEVPSMKDIKQGEVGDCYLMAALQGIVKSNPKAIMDMMVDRGNCVDVRFKGYPGVITVSKMTVCEEERGADGKTKTYDYYSSGALWVKIIEKAYARVKFNLETNTNWVSSKSDIKKLITFINKNQNRYPQGTELGNLFREYYIDDGTFVTTTVRDLNNKFGYSVEACSGGECRDAIYHLLGISYSKKRISPLTADKMSGEYNSLWENASKGINRRDDRGELAATEADAFDKQEKVLGDIIKDLLKKELKIRHNRIYKKQNGYIGNDYIKNVTIEDIRDTIKDIRNWITTDINSVISEFRKKYLLPNGYLYDENVFFETINRLADKLYMAGNASEKFQHEAFAKDSEGRFLYTNKAKNVAKLIQSALGEGAVTFGTLSFFDNADAKESTGLNGETEFDGMVYGHAYMVLDIRETEQGQILIKAINPWGTKGLKYIEKHINGKTLIERDLDRNRSHGGVFEMDLNDFMRFVDDFDVAKSTKRVNRAAYNAV